MSKTEPVLITDNFIEEDSIDLAEYLGLLYENRWLIGGIVLGFFLFALVYGLMATPIYRADALLKVGEKSPNYNAMDALETMMMDESSSTVTEIEIIKSRKVIGEMVDAVNLTIEIAPQYSLLAYLGVAKGEKEGGEKIKIDRLDVPADLLGAEFTLVKERGEKYLLRLGEDVVLKGMVGQAAMSQDQQIQLFISQLNASEGTHFSVVKRSRAAVINYYQQALTVAEKGRQTGIVQLSLEGPDQAVIEAVLNEIIDSYIKQNVRRHSEESENVLKFISSQLPDLKNQLSAAESTLNEYRKKQGTIDITYESQSLIKSIADIEKTISELKLEKASLSNKLTPKHPLIQGVDEKLAKLQETRQQLESKIAKLPGTELESVKFSRDVTVANELYMLLLNKSQELKVAKAGAIGNVRVIDEAFSSEQPVKPRKTFILAISVFLGFIISVIIVIIKKSLNKTIRDPKIIENMGLTVYAEIPLSKQQLKIDKKKKENNNNSFTLLAKSQTDEHLVESLRSLRTSIQFAMMEANNNIVTISGPLPGVGKSFISANFAYVMADGNKKVLLVDADMRKGRLCNYAHSQNTPGLSELISSDICFDEVVHKNVQHNQNLHLITSGTYPPNPSELLMGKKFEQFLKYAQDRYDLVIIDTPAILVVTDAAIIARHSAVNFMVLRSGRQLTHDVEETIKRLKQSGISLKGAIFNGISLSDNPYRYGYKSYSYSYK